MALLEATANFIKNSEKYPISYTLFPWKKHQYNSNSFITGLLKAVSKEKSITISYKDTTLYRPGKDNSPHELKYSKPAEEINLSKPNRPYVDGQMIMR